MVRLGVTNVNLVEPGSCMVWELVFDHCGTILRRNDQ
jgi:hypothetical protein